RADGQRQSLPAWHGACIKAASAAALKLAQTRPIADAWHRRVPSQHKDPSMSLGTIGSGLDIPTLVSQLVASERAPRQNQINTAGTAATAKVSALGSIKNGMTSLQTAL